MTVIPRMPRAASIAARPGLRLSRYRRKQTPNTVLDGAGDLMGIADERAQSADVEQHRVGRGFFNARREVTRALDEESGVARCVKAGVHASFPVKGFEREMGVRTITRTDGGGDRETA